MLPQFETYYPYSNKHQGNALKFYLPNVTVWFSYQTVIAFALPGQPRVVSENLWGPTTGKHLNHIDPDHATRLPRDEFEEELAAAVEGR